MRALPTVQCLISATFLAALVSTPPAQADSPSAEIDLANSLLPLESRTFEAQTDPDLLMSVSNDINGFEEDNSTADVTDILGTDVTDALDEFVDENGNVDLPLGITVFEAMGTTSIGFGSDF